MVQQPHPPPGGSLRNRCKTRRNDGQAAQRGCTGIAGLRGIGRTNRKFSLFGHLSRRFACGFNEARRSLQHPVQILRCGDGCSGDGYRERINRLLTSFTTPPIRVGLFGIDLAHTLPKDIGTQCQEP
jgi:hypothetical protein